MRRRGFFFPNLKAEVSTMRRMGNCSALFLGVMERKNYFIAPIGSEAVRPEGTLSWSVVLSV